MTLVTLIIKDMFYFICKDFLIADLENCAESVRTFDFSLYNLANNGYLLNLIGLHYIGSNTSHLQKDYWTYEKRAEWFIGYLSQFTQNLFVDNFKEKCNTNPTLRLLITNDEMINKIIKK
jgi:hypothetical protein